MASPSRVNPLITQTRASDTSPQVQLHPLVLLTISDYITRHELRRQTGPIVGAILGQQNGREVTMEVAFECKMAATSIGEEDADVVMDWDWFSERLESYKEVYAAQKLDLVGWYTTADTSGPQAHFLPVHRYLQTEYNESCMLLLFYPSLVADEAALARGRLPLSIYESVWLGASASAAQPDEDEDEDGKAMEIDSGAGSRQLKFREMEFAVETGEAETIAMDFVSRGAGNAMVVEGNEAARLEKKQKAEVTDTEKKGRKGKRKQKSKENGVADVGVEEEEDVILSAEDEDLLQTLSTKTNAIKMLQSRVRLLSAYLSSLPPSYLSDASFPIINVTKDAATTSSSSSTLSNSRSRSKKRVTAKESSQEDQTQDASQNVALDHQILRSIAALVTRLPLLTPPASTSSTSTIASESAPNTGNTSSTSLSTYAAETLSQSSDVALVNLLANITSSVHAARELGLKHAIFESVRSTQQTGPAGVGINIASSAGLADDGSGGATMRGDGLGIGGPGAFSRVVMGVGKGEGGTEAGGLRGRGGRRGS